MNRAHVPPGIQMKINGEKSHCSKQIYLGQSVLTLNNWINIFYSQKKKWNASYAMV